MLLLLLLVLSLRAFLAVSEHTALSTLFIVVVCSEREKRRRRRRKWIWCERESGLNREHVHGRRRGWVNHG